jgi:predicted amidohydrolase
MNICVAQIQSARGDIASSFQNHLKWIDLAIAENADFIVFPELSLTGYEPRLAKQLLSQIDQSHLDRLQKKSNEGKIGIGIGAPTQSRKGLHISMLIFQPNQKLQVYSKQQLHSDELPYFTNGEEQLTISDQDHTIAPAICYESLQPDHIKHAIDLGANIYIASVAKSQSGVEKAMYYFPAAARKYSIPILMSNCVGLCDDFESAGQSAIWDENGRMIAQLDHRKEGVLFFNTITGEVKSSDSLTR